MPTASRQSHPSSRPNAISDNFLSDNHSLKDTERISPELMHSSRDVLHTARKEYLIQRGQILEPKGINKREEI